MVDINDFIQTYGKNNEKKLFKENEALAYLLTKDKLFLNSRPYIENPYDSKEEHCTSKDSTIVIFVNANDLFIWACAEGVEVTNNGYWEAKIESNELYRLTLYVTENERWGADKFCCWKRNMQPQKPVIDKMKKEGVWTDFMESLPKNPDTKSE